MLRSLRDFLDLTAVRFSVFFRVDLRVIFGCFTAILAPNALTKAGWGQKHLTITILFRYNKSRLSSH